MSDHIPGGYEPPAFADGNVVTLATTGTAPTFAGIGPAGERRPGAPNDRGDEGRAPDDLTNSVADLASVMAKAAKAVTLVGHIAI